MRNYKSIVAAVALSLSLVASAKADILNPYVGFDATLSRVKSKSKTLFGLAAGNTFKFGNFYVEPGLRFNAMNDVLRFKRLNNLKVKDVYNFNLNFGYEVIDSLSVFASASENYMQVKSREFNKHKFVMGYGAGLKYDVLDSLSLNARYDHKKFKKCGMKFSANQVSLGVNYNF